MQKATESAIHERYSSLFQEPDAEVRCLMMCARTAAVVVLLPYSCEFNLLEVALTLKVEGKEVFRVKSFNFLLLLLRRTLHSGRCTAQWDRITSILTRHIGPFLPRRIVRPLNPLNAWFAFC
jgi:hypothetical protein